jgi:hypothetical protein
MLTEGNVAAFNLTAPRAALKSSALKSWIHDRLYVVVYLRREGSLAEPPEAEDHVLSPPNAQVQRRGLFILPSNRGTWPPTLGVQRLQDSSKPSMRPPARSTSRGLRARRRLALKRLCAAQPPSDRPPELSNPLP